MEAPIVYIPNVFCSISFDEINKGIIWEQRDAPRSEAYYAQKNIPYTYGRGTGERTYWPHVIELDSVNKSPILKDIWWNDIDLGNDTYLSDFELLFCNRYMDQHQHLGWHADDSPSVDANRPIVVITFGAEREIWFKRIPAAIKVDMTEEIWDGVVKEAKETVIEKLTLEHGSVLIMLAGMQQTHLHRIPKHSRPCGPRISLTFRGLTPGLEIYEDKH